MLWAALFFPQLAIDMTSFGQAIEQTAGQITDQITDQVCDKPSATADNKPDTLPLAIVLQQGTRRLLMSCNSSARELGLKPGQTLNSAYAIAPNLYTLDYDEKKQLEHIEHLSLWAMQYSSWVTPYLPDTVLVEVKASLSLFGGLDALVQSILNNAASQGLHLQMGIASTPAAARLLARFDPVKNTHPNLQNPDSQNPDSQNPNSQNPNSQNPNSQNPNSQNPDSQNPDSQNPDSQNPNSQNPNSQNPNSHNSNSHNSNSQNSNSQNSNSQNSNSHNSNSQNSNSHNSNSHNSDSNIPDSHNSEPQHSGTEDLLAACPSNQKALREHLGPIPIDFLPLDEFTQKGLRQSGIKHCEQLFALPAASLTRRFGKACTELVYKLLGTLPEPCPAFKAPERFTRSLDLPLEAPDASALQFPLNRLLNALSGFLRSSDLGVKTLHIVLNHHRLPPTRVTLGFLEATADHKHLLKTANERLAATTMAEPAIAISIDAAELDGVTRTGKDLFNKSQSQAASIEQAFDILAARLGPERVFTTAVREDHRPEKAPQRAQQKRPRHESTTQTPRQSKTASPETSPKTSPKKGIPAKVSTAMIASDSKRAPGTCPARPLWLLKQPRKADMTLILQSSAERIENGWWCDDDVRRDYYLVQDQQGTWYWAYTLRQSQEPNGAPMESSHRCFYIHGVFA